MHRHIDWDSMKAKGERAFQTIRDTNAWNNLARTSWQTDFVTTVQCNTRTR
jgi:hypothetical protein